MYIQKNIIKSIIISFIITFGFIIFFDVLGMYEGNNCLAMTISIVFTMLFCTYSIIDQIITKDNKEEKNIDNENLE